MTGQRGRSGVRIGDGSYERGFRALVELVRAGFPPSDDAAEVGVLARFEEAVASWARISVSADNRTEADSDAGRLLTAAIGYLDAHLALTAPGRDEQPARSALADPERLVDLVGDSLLYAVEAAEHAAPLGLFGERVGDWIRGRLDGVGPGIGDGIRVGADEPLDAVAGRVMEAVRWCHRYRLFRREADEARHGPGDGRRRWITPGPDLALTRHPYVVDGPNHPDHLVRITSGHTALGSGKLHVLCGGWVEVIHRFRVIDGEVTVEGLDPEGRWLPRIDWGGSDHEPLAVVTEALAVLADTRPL